MKIFIIFLMAMTGVMALASENYTCISRPFNMELTINDNGAISLKTKLTKYECELKETHFPGTEAPMKLIECSSDFRNKTYYFARISDTEIVLSPDWILQRDINCTKN